MSLLTNGDPYFADLTLLTDAGKIKILAQRFQEMVTYQHGLESQIARLWNENQAIVARTNATNSIVFMLEQRLNRLSLPTPPNPPEPSSRTENSDRQIEPNI